MIDQKYYDEFTYLKDCIYLDSASVGMQPERTLAFCRAYQTDFAYHYGRSSFTGKNGSIRQSSRDSFARLIGADADEVASVQHTTEGTSILVDSLTFDPGDNVIVIGNDYPSVVLGWVQKQAEGLELRLVKPENGVFTPADIEAKMDGRTRLLAMTLVHNHTGFWPDIEAIGQICHERGVLFAVDGIQALGRIPVDVKTMHIDYLSSGTFKHLMGTFGAAYVYCRRDLQPMLKGKYYNDYNIQMELWDGDIDKGIPVLPYRSGMDVLEGGAQATYNMGCAGKSMEMLLEIGIENVRETIRSLEMAFRKALREDLKPLLWGSDDPARQSGILCMRVPLEKEEALQKALDEIHAVVYLEDGLLRIAPHFFNRSKQLELVAETINGVL